MNKAELKNLLENEITYDEMLEDLKKIASIKE
jgi:hypothetical protein